MINRKSVLRHYIMEKDGTIRPVSLLTWAKWFENVDNRRVAWEDIGDLHVSTVFLGLDHNWGLKGDPILFETMIFDKGGESVFCARYSTREQAIAGHQKAVRRLKRV